MFKALQYCIFSICLLVSLSSHSQQHEHYLEEGDKLVGRSQFDSAIYIYNKGVKECSNCHDTILGEFYAQIGKTYSLSYNKENAIKYLLLSLDQYKKHDQAPGKAKLYIYLAEYWRGLGQYNKAKSYLKEFERINTNNTLSLRLQAHYYNRKAAIIQESSSDTAAVIEYSDKVLAIAKKINIKSFEASTCNELGFLYMHNARPDLAENFYKKSLDIYENTNDVQSYIGVLINLIRLYDETGKADEVLELCTEGLQLIEPYDLNREKRDLYLLMHFYFEKKEKYKEALHYYFKHQDFNYQVLREEFNEKLVKIDKEYDVDKEKSATQRELERADFAEREAALQTKKKNVLMWFLAALIFLIIIVLYLFFRLRNTNKKLANNLKQKTFLFQELHHRVKNNLTLLNSLLFLRAKRSDNKEVKEVLTECQNRVHSIALVHQNLYQIEDTSKINLTSFIEQLFNELGEQIPENKTLSDVIISGYEQEVDMSLGVFIGLIFNEMFTNSLKYANPPEGKLSVKVDFKKEKGRLFVTYSDNGQGLPENVTLGKNGGFGFKMIQITMDQLNTSMEYEKTEGFSIFRFSVKV